MKQFYILLSLILATSFSQLNAEILYVKPGTTSTAWQNQTNVYSDLQTALTAAVAGDEVWVAAGIYKPATDGNRDISFELKDGVHYYGGFVGDETELSQRNWRDNETILSGDIGVEGDNTDNSYNVLMASGTESSPITDNTRLDGFIIENGYSYSERYGGHYQGGGLYLKYAAPVIMNCHFRNNYASNRGGAVSGDNFSDGLFGNVIFSNNSAKDLGGAVSSSNSAMEFYNCVWYDNHSDLFWGAIRGRYVKVYNSIAWNNSASRSGDNFSVADVYYSIYKGASSDDHNISADPQFIDPENGDFRVRKRSPAINRGNSENLPYWLKTDFSGNARIQNDTIDIGIFEGGEIETPLLESPSDQVILESTVSEILLEWRWIADVPENITGYEVEYVIDDVDTTVVKNVQQMNCFLTGVNPGQKIQWCVRGLNGSGLKNWSRRYEFYISRGHPIYVKSDANGDGTSWESAMGLKEAIDVSMFGDSLWVAGGTYKPTSDGDRSISFELKEGVKYYGGFSGDETELRQRDWQINETILSGDIGDEDDNTDNSFHVLIGKGTVNSIITDKTRIDGFIIEKGYANVPSRDHNGGGLFLKYASPVILNCHFKNNFASHRGGAVFGNNSSDVFFGNVIFSGNSAEYGRGFGVSWAVYAEASAMELYNCVWYNNSGGVYGPSAKVYNSISWNNSASTDSYDFHEVDVFNSIYKNGSSNNHNISADPQFVDPENSNFFLQAGSPAINAGNNEYLSENIQQDYAGLDRIFGDNVDMGVIEFRQPNNVSPKPQGSGTKDYSTLGMVIFSWEITDFVSDSVENVSDDYHWNIKIWEDGEEANPVHDGEISTGGLMGESNSTALGGFDFGSKYHWQIGLEKGNYISWSTPTSFFIGHDHVVHVKEGNAGTTGKDWSNAFGTLHEALDYALPGDEIWVAKGIYHPVTPGDPDNVSQTEREVSLSLKPGMLMYGGFSGDEVSLSQRKPSKNTTIISGDIGVEGDISDNSIHLFNNEFDASSSLKREVIIDGFIMEGASGSAMYNVNASPSIEYCIFRNNEGENGAAVYNENSSPYFYNVLFYSNSANLNGGAIYGDEASNPELLNCTVGDNSASSGGGLYGSSKVRNSIVYANEGGQIEGSSDVAFSCVENGFDGEGNIQFDPVWKDAENHDYQLTEFSSCIDQGNGSLIPAMFSYDLAHNTRKHNFYVDMGAYEAQSIGKLEVVDSPLLNEEPIEFIDSITIRYNQPIKISEDTVALVSPAEDMVYKVSDEDNTVLVIKHTGLESATDYQLSLPYGYVKLATNDMIVQRQVEYDFTTRSCIPVALSVENSDVTVCPQTSVTLDADISGDALDYLWVFNQEDTLNRNDGSLLIDTVMPENTGEYVLKATDWCESSDEISLNLQYKSGTELIVPEPKWNTVYFVDNNTGNLSGIKWYLDGVEVSDKQYLDTKSLDRGELTVVAFDEASQCSIYGEVGQTKSASLKSAIVSPNPVASGNPVDIVLPEMSEKSRIRLYDMRGAKLLDQEFVESGILQLEDTDFSSGVYLLQIESNDGFIENKKLIIE